MAIKDLLEAGHLGLEFVMLYLIFRLNYKWNTVLDRIDLLYKDYCDEHGIPFKGLKNDYE